MDCKLTQEDRVNGLICKGVDCEACTQHQKLMEEEKPSLTVVPFNNVLYIEDNSTMSASRITVYMKNDPYKAPFVAIGDEAIEFSARFADWHGTQEVFS